MDVNTNKDAWIETVSGRQFHFLDPQPEEIDIGDIAHALSINNRFTGHTPFPYSVAEHSIYVSFMVGTDPLMCLTALLHDASEAYLVDIASPVKRELSQYRDLEDRIMSAISYKFGTYYPLPDIVHKADKEQTFTEAECLMKSKGSTWNFELNGVVKHTLRFGYPPMGEPWESAKTNFLFWFEEYNKLQMELFK